MAAGDVGNVYQGQMRQGLFQLRNEIAGSDLLVEEVVEQLHLRMIHRLDNFQSFINTGQIYFRIFYGVDGFEQQGCRFAIDGFALHSFCRGFQSVDTTLVMGFGR